MRGWPTAALTCTDATAPDSRSGQAGENPHAQAGVNGHQSLRQLCLCRRTSGRAPDSTCQFRGTRDRRSRQSREFQALHRQRGPFGPASLRFGPPAASRRRAGSTWGRPLIVPLPRTRATMALASGTSGRHIASNMRLVLDTSVLVAATPQPEGRLGRDPASRLKS